MTTIHWTDQAIEDLAAIRALIEQDSPPYASVVARLIRAVDRLRDFRLHYWHRVETAEIHDGRLSKIPAEGGRFSPYKTKTGTHAAGCPL